MILDLFGPSGRGPTIMAPSKPDMEGLPWPKPRRKHFLTAEERYLRLLAFQQLVESGLPKVTAAQMVGCSTITLWREARARSAFGLAGLMPRRPTGRSSPARRAAQMHDLVEHVKLLGQVRGLSAREAWLAYCKGPTCPRRILDLVTKAAFRKPKNAPGCPLAHFDWVGATLKPPSDENRFARGCSALATHSRERSGLEMAHPD